MGSNRKPLRNHSSGLHTNPENYDAFDILNKAVQKNINGQKLMPGPYVGKVLKIIKETDPNVSMTFKILVRLDIDSTPLPNIWSIPESRCFVGIENYFYPISSELEMPWIGADVVINLYDPENRIGVYTTLINSSFKNEDIIGTQATIKDTNSASRSFGE